jgi:hypothetical protein
MDDRRRDLPARDGEGGDMSHDTTPSAEKLAQALHACGLFEMEARARKNEWTDYDGPHALPQIELVKELRRWHYRPEVRALIKRIIEGEFDASAEESDAWWNREGREMVRRECPQLAHLFEKPS